MNKFKLLFDKMNDGTRGWISLLSLLFAYASGILMTFFYTLSKNDNLTRKPFYLAVLSLTVFLFLYTMSVIILNEYEKCRQSLVIMSVFSILIIAVNLKAISVSPKEGILYYIMLLFGLILLFDSLLMFIKLKKSNELPRPIVFLKNHYKIFAVMLCLSIIPTLAYHNLQRWDAAILYEFCKGIKPGDLLHLDKISFAAHTSQFFSGANAVVSYLVGNTMIGEAFLQILLYIYSVFAIYMVLTKLFPEKKEGLHLLLTLIYALSPYTFGLANYYFYDIWCIYLMPIIVYTYLYCKWIYHFFFAAFLCFSKEPGVVSYGGFCLGIVICEFFIEKKGLSEIKKYLGMLTIGTSWLAVYSVLPKWGGTGGFRIYWWYIKEKLKTAYILNFSWLLMIIAIFGIVLSFRKQAKCTKIIISILFSDVCFIILSALFRTVNHPRYLDAHIGCLYLLTLIGICLLNSKAVEYSIGAILTVLLFVSNYLTFDPLTLALFPKYNAGKTTIIASGDSMCDGMVYNRQYLNFDKTINMAIKESDKANSIYFLPEYEIMYPQHMDGHYSHVQEGLTIVEYWDENRNSRSFLKEDGFIPIRICNIFNAESIKGDCDKYFLTFPGIIGDEILETIRNTGSVLEEKEFESNGFVLLRVKVR